MVKVHPSLLDLVDKAPSHSIIVLPRRLYDALYTVLNIKRLPVDSSLRYVPFYAVDTDTPYTRREVEK